MDASTQPGHIVAGRYKLLRELGSGGFGRVWAARDEQLGRDVAIKQVVMPVLPPDQQEQRLAQALREGTNAAALADHPNIVTVYDVVIEGGSPWIVMQLVRGRSLHDALAPDPAHPELQTSLPVRQVQQIAESVLLALRFAHDSERRIVHRDVKPANILLADDGQVLLTDFGIAKGHSDVTLTMSGSVVGTMAYIAPERAEGKPGGPASDLFSLGVTLFEAVEGYSPFAKTDSNTGTLAAILVKPLPEMKQAGRLAPLIQALTVKEPAHRPSIDQALSMVRGTGTSGWTVPATEQSSIVHEAPPNFGHGAGQSRNQWQTMDVGASASLPRPQLIDDTLRPATPRPHAGPGAKHAPLVLVAMVVTAVLIVLGIALYESHKDDSTVNSPSQSTTAYGLSMEEHAVSC